MGVCTKDGFILNSSNNLDDVLNPNGITREQFDCLRLEQTKNLTDGEKQLLRNIRNSVPQIEESTIVQKVIPQSAVDAYKNGTENWARSIKGCVTRAEDTIDLKNVKSIYEDLRLDYPGSRFNKLDGSCGVLRFPAPADGSFKTPLSPDMGGSNMSSDPFTGNGFTKSMERVVPEFEMTEHSIPLGTELYKITSDGKEIFQGIYNGSKFVLP